jgi:hypothetical protein
MMKARTKPTVMEVNMSEVADVLRRAESALDAKDYALLKMLVDSHAYLAELLADKEMSLARLRKILFGASTEKTAAVTGRESESASSQPPGEGEAAETLQEEAAPNADSEPKPKPKPKRPGHGRNGADAYPGAEQIVVPHSTLHAGDDCPNGCSYKMMFLFYAVSDVYPYWEMRFQKALQRLTVSFRERIDKTADAPSSFQREPDLQKRCLINTLQAASVTPLPMGWHRSVW